MVDRRDDAWIHWSTVQSTRYNAMIRYDDATKIAIFIFLYGVRVFVSNLWKLNSYLFRKKTVAHCLISWLERWINSSFWVKPIVEQIY